MPKAAPRGFRCEFCGEELADPMLAFIDHIAERRSCRALWEEWRANVRRESGGS